MLLRCESCWPGLLAPSRHPHPLLLADSDLVTLRASHLSHNWLWGALENWAFLLTMNKGFMIKQPCELRRREPQEIALFCSLRSTLGLAATIVWHNLLISWVFIVWVVICGAGLLSNSSLYIPVSAFLAFLSFHSFFMEWTSNRNREKYCLHMNYFIFLVFFFSSTCIFNILSSLDWKRLCLSSANHCTIYSYCLPFLE